jgi:hypothetical protein
VIDSEIDHTQHYRAELAAGGALKTFRRELGGAGHAVDRKVDNLACSHLNARELEA